MRKLLLGAVASMFVAGAFASEIEIGQFGGHLYVDVVTGETTTVAPRGGNPIYDNVTAPAAANAGISSTDLNSIWGDRCNTLGTGLLCQFSMTVFNSTSGGNTGNVLTYTGGVTIQDASTNAVMGGFTTNVNFGAGLAAGFYTIVTFTNLEALNINLTDTDLLIKQQRTAHTGTSTRLGIASLNPLLAGTSSPDDIFVQSSTIGGGIPGFYLFGNPAIQANVGYGVNIPEPTSLALLAIGALAFVRRR